MLTLCVASGPLCSVLVNRFGCRPVMMAGGFFASLGMILASFATSIIHIYLCTGVITGRAAEKQDLTYCVTSVKARLLLLGTEKIASFGFTF